MRGALISNCGRYRYNLVRTIESVPEFRGSVLFVMLNPSTADAETDDPTIRKCMGFAARWGYRTLWVGNLFAWRATDPRGLYGAPPGTPIMDERNHDTFIGLIGASELIVAAWGAHASHPRLAPRAAVVRSILLGGVTTRVVHLGLTKSGEPKHPLMLPYSTMPIDWADR